MASVQEEPAAFPLSGELEGVWLTVPSEPQMQGSLCLSSPHVYLQRQTLFCFRSAPVKQRSICVTRGTDKQAWALGGASTDV